MKKGRDKICLDNDCRRKRNYLGSANTDRSMISKRSLEENLSDPNCSFENHKVCSNVFQPVQKHRLQNPKNIVIRHLNVNSLRNKFDAVEELVQNEIDICFLSEKKDEAFPNQQLMMVLTMVISYSAEIEIVMMESFYVTLMKISPPKL